MSDTTVESLQGTGDKQALDGYPAVIVEIGGVALSVGIRNAHIDELTEFHLERYSGAMKGGKPYQARFFMSPGDATHGNDERIHQELISALDLEDIDSDRVIPEEGFTEVLAVNERSGTELARTVFGDKHGTIAAFYFTRNRTEE